MSQPALITLLHISDFHFTQRKLREQELIVDALIRDLQRLCIGHRKPDLVLFTGDLVHAAGTDSHDQAYDFLLDKVAKVTGCSDERLFILPGNHEVQWPGLEQFGDRHNAWRAVLGASDESAALNSLYEAGDFNEAVQAKFSNYIELDRYLRGDPKKENRLHNPFASVDHLEQLNVDIVRFNTAVFSTGGNKKFAKDERMLAIPEYPIIEAFKAVKDDSLRIVMTHHPLNFLSEQSARFLDGEIAKHAHIHLFGHMHDPQPRNIVSLRGHSISDQAGAIFVSRKDYYSGYSLITIDRQNGLSETLIRSYYKDRDEFDDGIDIVKDGKFYPSQEARQHFRQIAAPINDDDFRKHLSGPALKLLSERSSAVGGDGDLHSRFVAPPFTRTQYEPTTNEDATIEIESAASFDEIAKGRFNTIIYARPEYGRTFLLKELRYRCLSDALTIDFPRLPALIDFADITSNADNMARKLRAGAELLPENTELESLLKLGHVAVLIDDVMFHDVQRMRILREFVGRYPKALYVLSCPQAVVRRFGACVDPEMPVRFEFVEVKEFRRNDMRQLLAKEERCTDVEEWLDRLQSEFKEINLPFTAANGSLLIEILSVRYNFSPVNRAVLLEQFIDLTLQKASIEQSRRETFDYTNKIDLLSHLAAWMARNDVYVPSREDLRGEMKSYVDTRGLNVSLDELMSEFLTARIFVNKSEERISFRYRAVLEYFIAVRMTVDPSFKAWIMDEDRYLRYVNEISYYAGKVRSDATLLETVFTRHLALMDRVFSPLGPIDLNQFDSLQVPRDKDGIDETEIAQPPLTKQEKDEELEAEFPKDEENRQEVFRPKADEEPTRAMLSLILFSSLIKNMELIPDHDKRRYLSEAWRSWALLLVSSLRFAPRLARERKMRVDGVLYEVHAPQGMSYSTLLRQMILRLPHAHVRMISNMMGTEKLERQLTEPILGEVSEPLIFEFFRVALLADLRLKGTGEAISRFAGRLQHNEYLLRSLVIHVAELRRMDRIRKVDLPMIEETLATSIADLRGGTKGQRETERNKQVRRLAKERLVVKIGKDHQKDT